MSPTPARTASVLVVDDDREIRTALTTILRGRRYRVWAAGTAREALDVAIEKRPDLVVLDLSLPDESGLEVCRELRTWTQVPILILTVSSDQEDKIQAFDLGADDYLSKPFSAGELLARTRALLRRAACLVSPPPVVQAGDVEVDIARRQVRLGGAEVAVTPTEFDVLAVLARTPDVVVSQRELAERVWGRPFEEPDGQTLRVHVSRLRHKIERVPAVPEIILTVPGVGFRFNGAPTGEESDPLARPVAEPVSCGAACRGTGGGSTDDRVADDDR